MVVHTSPSPSPRFADDARAVAWWVLVGVASGAIAGLVVGGIGGRLAMLLLRLTTGDHVIGMTSDDGFEIGVFTFDTVNLLGEMAAFGGLNGVLYAAVRGWLPRRLRLPLWMAVSAGLVAANVVHEDGVDFTLLEPTVLAIALFVALPATAAVLVVVIVERWVDRQPFADRRLTAIVCVAALCGSVALVAAAVVGLVALAGRRTGASRLLRPVARVAAPVVIAAIAMATIAALVDTASSLL